MGEIISRGYYRSSLTRKALHFGAAGLTLAGAAGVAGFTAGVVATATATAGATAAGSAAGAVALP